MGSSSCHRQFLRDVIGTRLGVVSGQSRKIAAQIKDYGRRFANPFVVAEMGFMDGVTRLQNATQAGGAGIRRPAAQNAGQAMEEA